MRAVVFEADGVVEVADRPDPAIEEPGDAVLRVTRAGICGSDLHFFHGKAPMDPGTIMGHEAVGTVERVGTDVRTVRPGDRVVTSFHIACGTCWFCRSGRSGLCEDHRILGGGPFGGDLPGTQAQAVRVPIADVNLLAVPDAVEDERALFVGDVLTTGVYAASLAEAGPEDAVAILGAGPVGFCVAQALRATGARRVFALDRDPARLTLIATHGRDADRRLDDEPGDGAGARDRGPGRRRRRGCGRHARCVELRVGRGAPRRPRDRGRHVHLRDRRAAAGRRVDPRPRPPVRGRDAGARVVGRHDGRAGRRRPRSEPA